MTLQTKEPGGSPPLPTVHEAELSSGPSGAVEWGAELTDDQAVNRRKQGLDIVVRGATEKETGLKAAAIEKQVGTPITADPPHRRAGPMALPHYHQVSRSPGGHSFYETTRRKAKRKKES
jgi:hypothetical protein